jgi:hypothetical protein
MSQALELVDELAGSRSALAKRSLAFRGVFVLLSLAVMGVYNNLLAFIPSIAAVVAPQN